ncbi:NAD-binding lipoprotein [Streptomyces sp. NPDC048514]|uniref:CASTOR/POLLUX-related putative ion channel n=1 Tax=Streptomyces sp. NPDC048514 TaxID=3365564 RepID=UPI00371942D2
MAERRQASLRDRARYLFDRTLARSTGTLLGWLALCCLAIVVPVSTLLVWMDPTAPRSLSGRLTAVWRTSAETLRLGAVTGAPLRMLLAVLLGLIALLCVSTLVGVITTGLGDRLAELRRGRSTVLERGHAVVLGWSDQVFTVVGELVTARSGRGRGAVAVLADRDTTEMEEALRAALGPTGKVRLVCRSGSPADPGALALVTPAEACSVLVLPAEDTGADLEVVRTLLALRALFGAEAGPPVVAAVRDGRYLPVAEPAVGERGTVLETDLTTAQLLVQSARRPGLPAALRDLLDFAGAEFHLVDAPELAGLDFAEIVLRFAEACVVGLVRADGRPLLTPAPQTVFTAGDRLVVVAHDDDTAAALADCREYVDLTAPAPAAREPERCRRTLLLGWNRRAPLIVDVLRRTSPPGSRLDVVTDADTGPSLGPGLGSVTGSDAGSGLGSVTGPVTGSDAGPVTGPVTGSGSGSGLGSDAAPVTGSDAGSGTGPAATRAAGPPDTPVLDVAYHVGDLLRPETLRPLDVFGYDSVIVLGPDPGAGAGCERPDDRTLLILLMLRSREDEAGRALPAVAELCDHRSRALAPLGPVSDAVVRGELTALLMAQIAHRPALAPVFAEIFATRGGALDLRPATHYVPPGREASFATVVAAASRRGECAIGYRISGAHGVRRDDGLRLCPGKAERRVWAAGDEVLVLLPTPDVSRTADTAQGRLPGMRQERREDDSPDHVAG